MATPDCIYCGAAQYPHAFLWTDALIGAALSKLPQLEYALSFLSPATILRIFDIAIIISLLPLRTFRVLRFEPEPSPETSARTRAFWDEARRRGITMEQASLLGRRSEVCRVRTRGRWTYFTSIPDIVTAEYTPVGNVDDKSYFKSILQKENLPYARGSSFFTRRRARAHFQAARKPVIVKPRFGSRARHTSLDIRDAATFQRAMDRAFQISPWCMVEDFIPGDLYRATCVGGKVIGVVHFIKPTIEADGVHTARELLAIHNTTKKHPNLTDVRADALFLECLERQGLTMDSVPERGRVVLLAEHSERPNGGYFIDCTDAIPTDTITLIERAARATRSPLIGFDIISRDLRKPHVQEPLSFIEANRAPFIELHDIPYEGTPRSVAAAHWDLWEESRRKDK
jgi:D-alanine-D-alanine ligase-like ATP-grasp enzyme